MIHTIVGIISRLNSENKKEYLLVKSLKDFGEYTGFYYPPGGHVEDGEELSVALARELKEELLIDAFPIKEVVAFPADMKDELTHYWDCDTSSIDIENYNRVELADVRWFTRDEMESVDVWPVAKKVFEQYIFTD